jgi:hypothetical protein
VAQRVQTILIDDITGEEIADGQGETIQFAWGGVAYQIDLGAKNIAKFEKAITPFVEAATRVGKANNVTPMRRSRKNEELDTQAVRAWAESNGYEVSSRGRIRGEIIEAFRAANA